VKSRYTAIPFYIAQRIQEKPRDRLKKQSLRKELPKIDMKFCKIPRDMKFKKSYSILRKMSMIKLSNASG